jgi:hypothetical protein
MSMNITGCDMETASIGEEMDENYLFEADRASVTSIASSTASTSDQRMRPKGFSISGGFHKFWKSRKDPLLQSEADTQCQSKFLSASVVPKIRCSNVSAPATPITAGYSPIASSWTYGYHVAPPLKHNTSFSSVDEESYFPPPADDHQDHMMDSNQLRPDQHEQIPGPIRSKSRLSLNLMGNVNKDKSPTLSAGPRSPRILPKMLRSSFSKLFQRGNGVGESSNQDNPLLLSQHAKSGLHGSFGLRHGNSINSINTALPDSILDMNWMQDCSTPPDCSHNVDQVRSNINDVEDHNNGGGSLSNLEYQPPFTPSTQEYLDETKATGLPVIPFAYPTCVLVDRLKYKKAQNNYSDLTSAAAPAVKKAAVTCFAIDKEAYEEPKSPPGTLESIVDIAQRELREEQPSFDQVDFDDDFLCGSVGSTYTISDVISRPRSRHVQASWDEAGRCSTGPGDSIDIIKDPPPSKYWHDYLDMNTPHVTSLASIHGITSTASSSSSSSSRQHQQHRSVPISIDDSKQY